MVNRSGYSILSKENARITVLSALAILFLILSVLSIRSGASPLWLVPPALLLASVALLSLDKFLLFTVILVPSSVQLRFLVPETAADLFLPTEIMLAAILLLMIFKLLYTREIDRKILYHPVSVISFCMIGWCLFTSITGTMPIVSFKSFVTRLWFFTGFYLLAAHIFTTQERIRRYLLAYTAGMLPVVIYFLIGMWERGWSDQRASFFAIRPFFNDHTSFGAALAFLLPVVFCFLLPGKRKKIVTLFFYSVFFFFSVSLILSYSRAAWLSLVLATILTLVILLRISWKIVIPGLALAVTVILLSWSSIMIKLGENRHDSSDNVRSQIESIGNIRSDASNMERINRWKSAIRMFRERPLLGWGPAVYQFKYAPFQISSEKTVISTNYGERGNAHSEYLGTLVDSGIPGLSLYIILLIVTLRRGIIIIKSHPDKQIRYLTVSLIAGLITYVIHGGLNNFLDTDKISALFWGMIAMVVAIDIRMRVNSEN